MIEFWFKTPPQPPPSEWKSVYLATNSRLSKPTKQSETPNLHERLRAPVFCALNWFSAGGRKTEKSNFVKAYASHGVGGGATKYTRVSPWASHSTLFVWAREGSGVHHRCKKRGVLVSLANREQTPGFRCSWGYQNKWNISIVRANKGGLPAGTEWITH